MATVTPIEIAIYSLSANGVLDDASPMYAYVKVPSIVTSVTECIVSLAFRQFSANATAASSGGSSTSGASSATSSGASSGHTHTWATQGSAGSGGTSTAFSTASSTGPTGFWANVSGGGSGQIWKTGSETSNHDHTIAHTHSTPNHTHGLTYGTYEESYPASHSVFMNVYKRVGSTWTLQGSKTAITSDLADLDLTSLITGPGDYQLRIKSDTSQPNSGRLGCDLYGSITAQIG